MQEDGVELVLEIVDNGQAQNTLATQIWSATAEAFFARAALPSLLLVLVVELLNTGMSGLITQNEFNYSSLDITADRMQGVVAQNSSFFAADNRFTNVWRAFDINLPSNTTGLVSNEITYSQNYSNSLIQAIQVDDRALATQGPAAVRARLRPRDAVPAADPQVRGVGVEGGRHAQVRLVAADLAGVVSRLHGADLVQAEEARHGDHPGPDVLALEVHHGGPIGEPALGADRGDDPVLDEQHAVLNGRARDRVQGGAHEGRDARAGGGRGLDATEDGLLAADGEGGHALRDAGGS